MASKLAIIALLSSTKAAEFTGDEKTMPCFSATAVGDTSTYVGQYCLNKGNWYSGQCCDITSTPADGDACAAAPQYVDGAFTSEAAFCGTKATLSNKFLREFLMPSNSIYCPVYNIE